MFVFASSVLWKSHALWIILTTEIACEQQAHIWVTRAKYEEQSHRAERSLVMICKFRLLAASPPHFERACAPTWACPQATTKKDRVTNPASFSASLPVSHAVVFVSRSAEKQRYPGIEIHSVKVRGEAVGFFKRKFLPSSVAGKLHNPAMARPSYFSLTPKPDFGEQDEFFFLSYFALFPSFRPSLRLVLPHAVLIERSRIQID